MQSLEQLTQAQLRIDSSFSQLSAIVKNAADLQPRGIEWLWKQWLPTGKLTILAGDGGTGKTTLLLGVIAILTTRGRWPDGTLCEESGNVLIWSGEDDVEDTLLPRLIAMGADLERVHFIHGRTNENGEKEPFDPAEDVFLLKKTVAAVGGVKLMMVDPIMSAVKGDSNKANDVRRGLQAIVDFAVETKAAVIGITHFSKGTKGASPAERVIGSQAFTALARMVWVAARQEEGEDRVLARAKSNISIDEGGVAYQITESVICDESDNPITTTRIDWKGLVVGSAREILNQVEMNEDNQVSGKSAFDEVCELIVDLLSGGPKSVQAVKAEIKAAGQAWRTAERVRSKLNIKSRRGDEYRNEDVKIWYWELLNKSTAKTDAASCHPSIVVGGVGGDAGKPLNTSFESSPPTPPNEVVGIVGEFEISEMEGDL
ncbi:MAG: AAA family ATPase [Advenella sp.]